MAKADDGGIPFEVERTVAKAFETPLSPEERDMLVRDYPEIARSVPDLESVTSGKAVAPAFSARQAMVPAATKCTTYSGWNTMKSITGTVTLYKFSHEATVCSNGSVVTSHGLPSYTMSSLDYTVDNWSVTDRSVKGVRTWKSTSRIQVRVQQCLLKIGCFAVHYPTGTIAAKGNNTADINTTVR